MKFNTFNYVSFRLIIELNGITKIAYPTLKLTLILLLSIFHINLGRVSCDRFDLLMILMIYSLIISKV